MSKMSPADWRKFGGIRFALRATKRKKSDAKKVARSYRKKGFNARVVKGKTAMHKRGWHVYVGRRYK